VSEGDTLTEISVSVYGTSRRWREIAAANGISEPWVIRTGQVLRLP
jgi:nucleoid-associated protein YgaU